MGRRGQRTVLAFVVRSVLVEHAGRNAASPLGRSRLSSSTIARAATRHFPNLSGATMTKTNKKIGVRNPFIPSIDPICRASDDIMILTVAVAGIIAAIAAVLHQFGAW